MKVRILLNDTYLDPTDPRDNTHTVEYVHEIAQSEGLDLQARIADSGRAGLAKIHNKGIIVDERKVFVSSVNWSQNSPANNREVGLIIDHPAVGAYFTDLFTYDWYDGSPADYPLITEVAPAFIEISHFGRRAVDLSGWTLTTSAGEWTLPDGSWVRPGQPLVITPDPATFRERYGGAEHLIEVPGLWVGGDRDVLELRRDGRRVDHLAWGQPEKPWQMAGPALAPLCRAEPGRDTNTWLDWSVAKPATPGVAGCGR